MQNKNFSFVILAGGKGSRIGFKKQFTKLGNLQLWQWSVNVAKNITEIREIILVIPDGEILENNLTQNLIIAHGGAERSDSVLNGLKKCNCDFVMIHDAARPLLSENLLRDLIYNTDENCGAVPVLPIADALKKIENNNISCFDRENLFITQTPQSFPTKKLIFALENLNNINVKDDAEAWLLSGNKLNYVKGEKFNFKITWPEDFEMARALINSNKNIIRSGIGYDIHKLKPGRKLILGGILIEGSPVGLLGHSDADIITHSIMDAILGAANLPDIGNLFPASDENFKDADSIKLLENVIKLVKNSGYEIKFIDVVLQAQIPKLNKYREIIINNLAKYFDVNLKFKSAEELDDAGAGLNMTCWAVATLSKN